MNEQRFQRIFVRMMLLDQEALSTEDLTASFGWQGRDQVIQHDVQELNRVLFTAIEKSLAGTAGQRIVSDLYRGMAVSLIQCTVCGTTPTRDEEFYDLSLPIKGFSGLVERLLLGSSCSLSLI